MTAGAIVAAMIAASVIGGWWAGGRRFDRCRCGACAEKVSP